MISKKQKIKFENKVIEQLIFRHFNIRNFEISKSRSFYISSFQIFTPTHRQPEFIVADQFKSRFFYNI